jgi:hypothetical protein
MITEAGRIAVCNRDRKAVVGQFQPAGCVFQGRKAQLVVGQRKPLQNGKKKFAALL